VARDRKRARQRRRPVREPAQARSQAQSADRRSAAAEVPNLPAPLEHAGDVDEFGAALADRRSASGAEGVPLQDERSGNGSVGAGTERGRRAHDARGEGRPAERDGDAGAGTRELEQAFGEETAAEEAPVTRPGQPLHQRAIAFLRASWAELQRVQWPDRRHVTQATTVVLGFLVVAGVYLGLADWVAQKVVNFIL
jgi:preprotein translocase subunit SecE